MPILTVILSSSKVTDDPASILINRGRRAAGRPPRGSLVPSEIAVVDRHRVPVLAEVVGEIVDHDHGAVPAPGATDGDRQVRLALGLIAGDDGVQEGSDL